MRRTSLAYMGKDQERGEKAGAIPRRRHPGVRSREEQNICTGRGCNPGDSGCDYIMTHLLGFSGAGSVDFWISARHRSNTLAVDREVMKERVR